jgi:hypothetical protein
MFVVDTSSSLSGKYFYETGDTCGGNSHCKSLCNGKCCSGSNTCTAQRKCSAACSAYYKNSIKNNIQGLFKDVVKTFRDIEAKNGKIGDTRFGWVGFNDLNNGPIEEFTLTAGAGTYSKVASMIDDSYSQLDAHTCMSVGFDHVLNKWSPGKKGNRAGNADVVIMLTDGAYYCPRNIPGVGIEPNNASPAISAAEELRNKGTTIFAIDVVQNECNFGSQSYSQCSSSIDPSRKETLTGITGTGAHYFPVIRFDTLASHLTDLMEEVCSV